MTLIQDQDTPRRRRALWPAGFRIHPPIITTLIISTIVATAWRTGVFHHDLGLTTEYQYAYSGRQIQAGHWSTLFTNQLLTRNTFMCLSICLSVLVFVGFYEALAGSVRAIVVIVVTGIVGPLGVEAGLGLGNVLGSTWAANTLSTLDFGASAITAGGAGAVVALLRWRWLRIVALSFVEIPLMAENTSPKPPSLKQLQKREQILADREARFKGELDQVSAELKDVRARRLEAQKAEKAKGIKKPAGKVEG